jgi:hypothetical protein
LCIDGQNIINITYFIIRHENIIPKSHKHQSLNSFEFCTPRTWSTMNKIASWDIVPCSLRVDWRFRGLYCLHRQGDEYLLPWWWRQYALLNHQSTPRLHSSVYQKAIIFVLATMRTWNVTWSTMILFSSVYFRKYLFLR